MNKDKKKSLFSKIFKKVKISHLVILILLLAANSYAWFIYVNTVSNSMDVHIKSWNIDFQDGNTPVNETVNVYVDNVYPGMTTYTKDIDAYNYSEVSANVSFKLLQATVMGTTYITEEGRQENGQSPQQGDLTSAQLVTKLASDYPFSITFSLSTIIMAPENGTSTFTTTIAWPYESGDDDADTYWGMQAYDFRNNHPSDPCISLIAKIYITQANNS